MVNPFPASSFFPAMWYPQDVNISNSGFSANGCIYGTSSGYAPYIYDGPSQGGGNTFTYA